MRYISFLFLTLLFFSINSYNAQTTIEGVPFPSFTSINNTKVVLNGGGLREKYGFLDLYVGALYLKTSTKDADKIIMADEEMGIRIIIVSYKAETVFGQLLALGVGLPIIFQAYINMGVAVQLFPVTGQPLPLISTGGTSIWMTFMAVGKIILSS